MASDDGVIDAAKKALGDALLDAQEHVGEITLTVRARRASSRCCRALRDTPGLEYQQLMEIAGVDYPERPERFEVVYYLLSLTKNRRIRVKVSTDEATPVPSVTGLWPVAGWLEREVFDMYGVAFSGNPDLRRILTDYGFEGYPQRKDFPLTGHVELRYSEAEKRVVYEPVVAAAGLPHVRLPDAVGRRRNICSRATRRRQPRPPARRRRLPAPAQLRSANAKTPAETPKTTEKPSDTGAASRPTCRQPRKRASRARRRPRAKSARSREAEKP